MPNYSKSKIYKIVCNITGETYYGSTTQPLSVRIGGHRSAAKKEGNIITSKPIILRGNYDIVLCEECPCENKEQLHAIERKWIEENDCINKVIPGRKRAEYREANKEKIKQYDKQYDKEYYEANKEQLKQYDKEYREANKEQIKQRKKQYREANKEKIKQYEIKYRAAKKEAKKAAEKEAKKAAEKAANEELTYEQMINKMSELNKQCDELIIKLDN